jgi:leucyl aminopeptidase (aminopeptidase T)
MVDDRFHKVWKIDQKIRKAAAIAVKDVLAVKKNEEVVIITNPDLDVAMISNALYDAALEAGGCPTVIYQPTKTQLDFAEPAVIKALESEPAIAISISKEKLGKDKLRMEKPMGRKKHTHIFNYLMDSKKMRSFWSPGITQVMFGKTVPIDYKQLRKRATILKRAFDKADEVYVTAPAGTDITMGLSKRKGMLDDGDFRKAGTGGNIPCGEVFVSPELNASDGKIMFDGSISSDKGEIIIKKPINAAVKDGFVTKISGGTEAQKLRDTISRAEKTSRKFGKEGKIPKADVDTYVKNTKNLGELGIGLNEKAQIVGNMLEDEKVYGTCHIAIGSNYDNDAKSLIHLDGLVKNPTIILKTKGKENEIMKKGKIMI